MDYTRARGLPLEFLGEQFLVTRRRVTSKSAKGWRTDSTFYVLLHGGEVVATSAPNVGTIESAHLWFHSKLKGYILGQDTSKSRARFVKSIAEVKTNNRS